MSIPKDKESLAGYVAEMFVASHMKFALDWILDFHSFGSSYDRSKTDYSFQRSKNDTLEYGDAKGSISYENCTICKDHPYFKCPTLHWFFLVFRDEPFIYMVNGKSIYDKILSKRKCKCSIDSKTGEKSYYYVIKPVDMNMLAPNIDYEKIPIAGKYKTFGEFFNNEFNGNELQQFDDDDDIKNYINHRIAFKCDCVMMNDIPS